MTIAKLFDVPQITSDIGLEIEAEGQNLWKGTSFYWKTEQDGSLRGTDNAEYVLMKPLSLPKVGEALLDLRDHLLMENSIVDFSRRTSTHVHVNCTQLSFTELINYITMLLIYEEHLVSWCEPSRHGNLFCLQSKDAGGMLEALGNFVKTKNIEHLGDSIRYSAINVASLMKYGSVEIRCLEGTVDRTRILKWVGFLLHLREQAKTFKDPIEIISKLSEMEPRVFSQTVLGEHYKEFFSGKYCVKMSINGARRAQDIAFSRDWREEVVVRKKGFEEILDDLKVGDIKKRE